MKLTCVHCGNAFAIRADQLGGRGRCPHCRGEIILPKASDQTSPADRSTNPYSWFDRSVSGLVSMILHMALLIGVAFYDTRSGGEAEDLGEISIAAMPEQLIDRGSETLEAETPATSPSAAPAEAMLELESPILNSSIEAADSPLKPSAAPSLSGSGDAGAFDLGSVGIAGAGSGDGGDWDGMIQTLRRNGLEIVITFDSTGSMSGEIDSVKEQIRKIGGTLLKLVPKTRIGICTYRDHGDDFVVKGLPLTGDIKEVEKFLKQIEAGGGGDHPEAVEEGLKWTLENNKFRPASRKVILLFGDAPPHTDQQAACLKLAASFRERQSGVISTVTCRDRSPMPEFYAIADSGGGEAFLTNDTKQIVTQLMILAFGSRHKTKVLEAFELLEK